MLEDLVKQSCGDVPAVDGYGFGLVTFFQDVVTSLYSVNDPAVLQEPSKQFLIFYSHSVSPFCKNYNTYTRICQEAIKKPAPKRAGENGIMQTQISPYE